MKAVRFIGDDQVLFVSGLGLVLDATPALGASRAKVTERIFALVHRPRLFAFLSVQGFAIIANNGTIETIVVEKNAGELTQAEASKVLALL